MRIADIQRFCMHDGPGVRTTVFLKGCPLQCAWCHNPETQRPCPELLLYRQKCIGCGECARVCPRGAQRFIPDRRVDRELCAGCGRCAEVCPTGAVERCGNEYTSQQLLRVVCRDTAFYGEHGGVTISGGEPFAQGQETVEFLLLCKENGLHTAVETCGYVSPKLLAASVGITDLFLWDVKDTDEDRHRQYTGVSNKRILQNLRMADSLGARTRLRCILVHGVNAYPDHFAALGKIYHSLNHCQGVEFLPYHTYGDAKSAALGRSDGGRRDWIPSPEETEAARQALQKQGVPVLA